MKSIEARFKDVESGNPLYSSYICFYFAILKQMFTRPVLTKWFSKLVSRDDYSRGDKVTLLDQLEVATNE